MCSTLATQGQDGGGSTGVAGSGGSARVVQLMGVWGDLSRRLQHLAGPEVYAGDDDNGGDYDDDYDYRHNNDYYGYIYDD